MEIPRIERRLAAIMAADIAGYSRLMGEDEEGTYVRLVALRQDFLDREVDLHRGRNFKNTGDGFLAEFRSPVDAVRCGLVIQSGLWARNFGHAEPILFRIGINLG